MLNVRTWHRLIISGHLLFPGTVAIWLLPENSPFIMLALAALGWGILVALAGAILGVLFACGRLAMGCPRCRARSQITGGNRDGMYLECPSCGELRVTLGRLFGLKVIGLNSTDDDLVDYRPDDNAALRTPLRHPIPFAIIYLPVVASIVIAAVIYKFTFFYLLIPGFWCYAVGGLIVNALCTSWISDNHGTASRAKTPFRFWGKVLIWFLAYLFATAFPIGFAIQERNRAKARTSEGVTSQPTQPATRPTETK